MQVTVGLFGTLSRYGGSKERASGEWKGEIPDHSSVRDLIRAIGIPPGEVGGATVDGRLIALDAGIPPGARVLLFAWMAGG